MAEERQTGSMAPSTDPNTVEDLPFTQELDPNINGEESLKQSNLSILSQCGIQSSNINYLLEVNHDRILIIFLLKANYSLNICHSQVWKLGCVDKWGLSGGD